MFDVVKTLRSLTRPVGLLILLGACAQPVSEIKPDAGRANAFMDASCSDLGSALAASEAEMNKLAIAQERAVAQDVASVVLIGIPTSFGGKNKEIAAEKADQYYIRELIARRACH